MLGLENLFAWVPQLVAWMVSWLPSRGRLHVHEGGVKIRGAKVFEIKHGTYWWWPRWAEIYTDNIKRKVTSLPEQTLTTQDGHRVRIGGVLIYRIKKIIPWLIENEDPTHSVQTDAARILRDWVRSKTFAHIQAFQPKTREGDELTKVAQSELGREFGIWVSFLGFTDFAKTRAVDIYHSGTPPWQGADDEEA